MTLQAIVKALDRTKSTAQHMFRGADVDGSGYLSAREIELLLRDRVGLTLSSAEVQQLIAALDTKGTGTVSSVEFISRIRKVQRDLKARHRREQERIVRPRAPEPQMPEEETTALSAEERMKQVEHLKRILVGEDLAQHHSDTPLPKAAVKAAAEAAAAAEASAAKAAAAAEASEGVGDLASRLLAWEWDKPQQPEEAPGASAEPVPAGWAGGGEQAQLLREMALATGSNEVERAAFVNAELTAQREMLASRLAEQQAEWGEDGPAGSAGPISAADSERDALRMRSMEQHQQLLAAELARKQAEADSSLSPISLDGKQPEPQPEPQPRLSRAAAVDQMLKEAADAMPATQAAADGTEAAQWQQRLDSLKVQHAAARAPEAVSALSPQPTTLSDSSRALSASAQAPGESSPQSPLSPVLAGRWTQGESGGAGTLHYQPGQDIAAKLQRLKASRDRSGAGPQAGPTLSLEPLPAVVQPAQALRAATGAAETAAKPELEPEPISGGVSPQHPPPTGTLHILSPRSPRKLL